MPPPSLAATFPYTEVKSVSRWSNYHGTVRNARIPIYCTPDVMTEAGTGSLRRLARHGASLRAIVSYCFTTRPPSNLRVLGGRWSMSSLIKPGTVTIDPANLSVVLKVRNDWLTPDYRLEQQRHSTTPVFVQGGTHIASLNRRLAQSGLALQTSGASDGHRIAGCIATGTHGSALKIGAVHDTVLGIHLIVAPDRSVFLQPTQGACTGDVAAWLQTETGLPTHAVNDDELFAAAQVNLGSMGIVHGVVIEAVPLYRLQQRQEVRPLNHPDVWNALATLDTRAFHPDTPDRPYHFQLVLHPYPGPGAPGAFATMYWKVPRDGWPSTSPAPVEPELASDTMGLIASLSQVIDVPGSTELLRAVLDEQLGRRYKRGEGHTGFPGEIFGPTATPPGHGTSTEVVVSLSHARTAVEVIYEVIDAEARHGRHLLGAIGVRFTQQTNALLGMNIHPMNCYIELPSIRNREVEGIYVKIWDALEAHCVPFALHWGQLLKASPQRLNNYYGDRIQRWKAARQQLLPSPLSRAVFATPLLAELGLD